MKCAAFGAAFPNRAQATTRVIDCAWLRVVPAASRYSGHETPPSSSGVVRYELKTLYRVATRQVVFEPLDLVVKLADSARQQPTALHNFTFDFWERE